MLRIRMTVPAATFFTAVLCLAPISAHAHEEGSVGELKGEHIHLQYVDHVLAGTIGSIPLYATPLEGEYGIRVQFSVGSQRFESTFRKDGETLRGKLEATNFAGAPVTSDLIVEKVNAAAGIISGSLNGTAFDVTLSSESMEGNHYVNPTFSVDIGEKTFSFQLENGQACMGCALKIAYTVLTIMHLQGLF